MDKTIEMFIKMTARTYTHFQLVFELLKMLRPIRLTIAAKITSLINN